MGLSPMLEHREMGVVESAAFDLRLIVGIGHMTDEEVEQGFFVLISEVTICIAPFAVVFVETTIRLTTNHGIVRQRHSAALAVQGLG